MRRFPENANFFLSSVDVFTQMSTFSPDPFVGAIGYPFAINFLGFHRLFVSFCLLLVVGVDFQMRGIRLVSIFVIYAYLAQSNGTKKKQVLSFS